MVTLVWKLHVNWYIILGGCHNQLENGQTQDINKQMLHSEDNDYVVEDINPTKASETNVYILLNFFTECG